MLLDVAIFVVFAANCILSMRGLQMHTSASMNGIITMSG